MNCAYCTTDLPDPSTETERMDILQNHMWRHHPDIVRDVVTGEIGAQTYASIESQFLTSRMEQFTEAVNNAP